MRGSSLEFARVVTVQEPAHPGTNGIVSAATGSLQGLGIGPCGTLIGLCQLNLRAFPWSRVWALLEEGQESFPSLGAPLSSSCPLERGR